MDVLLTLPALKEAVTKDFQDFQDTLLIILLLTGPMDTLTALWEDHLITVLTALLEEFEVLRRRPRPTSSRPTGATAHAIACMSSACRRNWPLSRPP